MTTRQPIVPVIPPFKGGPLQNRNATNVQPSSQQNPAKPVSKHSQSSPSKPQPSQQQQQARQQQQQQPQRKPTTRLEREKKKTFNDPKQIGSWNIGKLIGQGASGRVRLAVHKETNVQAAVKIIPRNTLINSRMDMREAGAKQEKMTLGIEREIVIMKLIEHPNLLGLWDVYETTNELFLIMEYVAGGELFDHLVQKGKLTPQEARAYFRQIIFGVDYCHRFNICHRDLKPENLLLDATKQTVKVADFGMAALQPAERMLETSCGSPHYASPEIVSGKSYKGTASDIWSCGIILFALLCGKLPFDDPSIGKLLSKVKLGKFDMPRNLEPSAQDLIWKMLNVDPEQRLSMHGIMNHPWFTDNGRESNVNSTTTSFDKLGNEDGTVIAKDPNVHSEILSNLTTLWPDMPDFLIEKQLKSPGPNWQKTFYQLLMNHKDQHSGEEDQEGDEEEEVDRTVGGPGGLGLDLGIGTDSNDTSTVPRSRLERRSSTTKRETPRPRRSIDTSRGSSPNPSRRELDAENIRPSPQQQAPQSRAQPQNASQTAQFAHLVAHRAAPTSPARQQQQQQAAAAAAASTAVPSVNRSNQSSTPTSISTPTRPRSNTATQATPPVSSRVAVPSSPYAGRASVDTGRPSAAQLHAASAGGVSRPVSPLPPPSPNAQARGSSPVGPRRPSVSEGSTSSPAGSRIVGRSSMDQSRPMGGSSPSRPFPTPTQASNGSHTYSSPGPGNVASRVQAITYAQEIPRHSPVSSKREGQDVIPSLVRRTTSPSQKPQVSNDTHASSNAGISQVTAVNSRARSNSRSSTTPGRSHAPLITQTTASASAVPRPSSRSSSRPASPSKGTRPTSVFGEGNSGGPPSIQSPNLGNESDPLFKDITDQLAFMHQSGDRDGLETQFEKLRSSIGNSSAGPASVSTNRRSVYGEQSKPINTDAQFEDAEEEEELNGDHGRMDIDALSLSSNNSTSRNQSPYTPTSPLPPNLPNLGLGLGSGLNFSHNPTKPLALPDSKVAMVSRGGHSSTGMVRRHTDEVPMEKERNGVSSRSSSRSNAAPSSARTSTSTGRPLSLFSTSSRQSSSSTSTAAPTLGRKRSLLGSSRRNTSENDNPMTSSIRYEQTQEGARPVSGRVSRPSSPTKMGSEFIASSSPIIDHAREKANAKPTRLQMKNPGLGLEITSNQNHSSVGPGPASAPYILQGSSSPRSPNFSQGLQTPSTIHSQLASPALSMASSSSSNPPPSPQPAARGFLSNLFGLAKWQPAASTLYSTENLSLSSEETRRVLKVIGCTIDNGSSLGNFHCELPGRNGERALKLRVSLTPLAISNHSSSQSPNFGSGGNSPALSSNSTSGGRSNYNSSGNRGSLSNYSTSVTFNLSKGGRTHFEQVVAQVRNLWCLDSSPTAQSSNQNEIVGLGVH